jgi:putative effector of murein hydrolase
MIAVLVGIGATLAAYQLNMQLYRRCRKLWFSPMLLTPAALIAVMAIAGIPYDAYLHATQPLVWMIGPLTLALAIPVYQNRSYIREWWPALLAGTLLGSLTTMVSAIGLAHLFDLPAGIARSLVGRSISLPFAFVVSDEVVGTRSLTAMFVVASGMVGIVVGELLLFLLPFKTDQAHGAALGSVAQVVGVARAHEHGIPRGVMASLTMVFSGAFTVLVAPLLVHLL